MQLPVRNIQGQEVGTIEVDDQVFGLTPNQAVIHQVMVAQRANLRQGTASTKTRGEVAGSTRKIRSQKYTGRARLGSIRAHHLVGGGVAFGPKPRSYHQKINKRMRRLAIRSLLSDKAQTDYLIVLEELTLEQPRTKEIAAMLDRLGVDGSALLVTAEPNRVALLSARNLTKVKAMPSSYLNVLDLLNHRYLIMTVGAVRRVEGLWGGERANQRYAKPEEAAEDA